MLVNLLHDISITKGTSRDENKFLLLIFFIILIQWPMRQVNEKLGASEPQKRVRILILCLTFRNLLDWSNDLFVD